ncbi:MAG: phosphoribosylformylglycinamidine cyclo-ligase [Candidatus Sumerlaeota bacterium]
MSDNKPMTYKDAGHDLERSDAVIERLKKRLPNIGGFGGCWPLPKGQYEEPVLVSGTDGVGTKILVAQRAGKHDTVGIDCVAMVVNDILVLGGRPSFFLDYIAMGELEPDTIEQLVEGVMAGCDQAECELLGGETAEMAGLYGKGEYDLVGFATGVVERSKMIDGKRIEPGDMVVGLGSSGIHSNGYTLARAVFDKQNLGVHDKVDQLGITAGEALLTPTRIYVKPVLALLDAFDIRGMAHITGGGFEGNLNRALPDGCDATIDTGSWERPEIFDFIQETGPVEEREMFRTFNMGIGYTLVLPADQAAKAVRRAEELGENAWLIGQVTEGGGKVHLET